MLESYFGLIIKMELDYDPKECSVAFLTRKRIFVLEELQALNDELVSRGQ